jgi:diguanylate cyclase (GGDEF)-like protein
MPLPQLTAVGFIATEPEFAVLLPDTHEAGAIVTAHRIARAIQELNIPHAGSPHGVVTVSLGVAGDFPHRSEQGLSALMEAADRALYAAKAAGRGVVRAGERS